jgi:hypothetical protein
MLGSVRRAMKTLSFGLAGTLAVLCLVACSRNQTPESLVSGYLDFHRPGVWTPVVLDHAPFLDYQASAAVEHELDLYLASRLAVKEGTQLEREWLVESMALAPLIKYEIVSTTELGDGRVEVLAKLTRPKPPALARLWQIQEVVSAKWVAKEHAGHPESQEKVRVAKAVLHQFAERFKRTLDVVKTIEDLETTETHFIVKAGAKDGSAKLLLDETWTAESKKKQAEAAQVLKHSLAVLQVLKPEFSTYDDHTFISLRAYNPSNAKTGLVRAEFEVLDEQGRAILHDKYPLPELEPGENERAIAMFEETAPSPHWRVRFAAEEQFSPWYTFKRADPVAAAE